MKMFFCLILTMLNLLFISTQVVGQTDTEPDVLKINPSNIEQRLEIAEQCLVKLIQESEKQKAKKDNIKINGNIQFYAECPNKTTAFDLKPKYNIGQQILLILNGNIHEDMGLLVGFKQNACWGKWGDQYTETEVPFKVDEAYAKVRKFNGIATIGRQYFKLGPFGLIATNYEPFDGLKVERTAFKMPITFLFFRIATFYLPQNMNTAIFKDDYVAARISKEFKSCNLGINSLFSDIMDGKGYSLDLTGTLFNKGVKVEWANFKADSGYILYKEWVRNCFIIEGELINRKKLNLKARYGNIPLGFLPYATSVSFNPNQNFEEKEMYFIHNTTGLDLKLTCSPHEKITTEVRYISLKRDTETIEVDTPSSTQWIFNIWIPLFENGMLSLKFHSYSDNEIGRYNLHKIGMKFGF